MKYSGRFAKICSAFSAVIMILTASVFGIAASTDGTSGKSHLSEFEKSVRHELVMLPYYTVFDNLEFQAGDDGSVVLSGQVVWAPLKDHAERAARSVPGVSKIINNIEILPLLPYDSVIRRKVFHAVYSQSGLERYAVLAVPPIHIIVNNGRVTLEGEVESEMDKNVAELAANGVSNVHEVTSNLRIQGD